jgi:hypothetical protein
MVKNDTSVKRMISFKVVMTSHLISVTEKTLLTEQPLYMKNKYLKFNFKHGSVCEIQHKDMTLTLTQQP